MPRFAHPSEWMNQTFLSLPKHDSGVQARVLSADDFQFSANRQEPATVPETEIQRSRKVSPKSNHAANVRQVEFRLLQSEYALISAIT